MNIDLLWKLFQKIGDIRYYNLLKKLQKETKEKMMCNENREFKRNCFK